MGGSPNQDGSDLQAARNVVLGDEESMTYVPTRAMSEQAADVAVALLAGTPVERRRAGGRRGGLLALGTQDVTIDGLTSVLVGQGVLTLDELCSGSTEKRCAAGWA